MTRDERQQLLDRAYVLHVTMRNDEYEFATIARSLGVDVGDLRSACFRAASSPVRGFGPVAWDYYLPEKETSDEAVRRAV